MQVSIIVPVLNEAAVLQPLLHMLSNRVTEVIVVDGGSSDGSVDVARQFADHCFSSSPGRARQMNAGAACASGEWLWFVHADSRLLHPLTDYLAFIEQADHWGFFGLKLSGSGFSFRLIERFINWRSTVSSMATGDQGIFLRRKLFNELGGFAEQPLMEDVELSKCLRRVAPAAPSQVLLQTSSRRWEERGVVRTVLLMWRLRLLYFLGASPHWLARQYR
jgi:rSAM/selenodomain-associated transferase 2